MKPQNRGHSHSPKHEALPLFEGLRRGGEGKEQSGSRPSALDTPNNTHLHSEDEAVAVQRVLPVQKAIQGQRPADVVQSEDAVGVP